MNPQLMTAACHRHQANARLTERFFARDDGVARGRRFANRKIDHLPWTVRPVADQRQVNRALVAGDEAGHNGFVILRYESLLERTVEGALRVHISCKNHQPRRLHVEPMHDQGLRESGLYARAKAIGLFRSTTWDGQQAAGLVDHQKLLVNDDEV